MAWVFLGVKVQLRFPEYRWCCHILCLSL
jgi:hypothetical protein